MGRLSDILRNGNAESLRQQWATTEAAEEFDVLPAGEYVTRIASGELRQSRNGTPSYSLTFVVIEGPHANRKLWYDIWLTPAALPMAKRDLMKLGVVDLEQLERPIPQGIRCKLKVVVHRDDDDQTRNVIRRFTVVGQDEPQPDDFAPQPAPEPF